jgi:alpha-tubulin suppressor-like RCC1 family protein
VRFYPPAGVTYKCLASGGGTSYAISTTGDVYAWGASSEGQTGDGSRSTAMKPVLVESGATHISSTADDVAVSIR